MGHLALGLSDFHLYPFAGPENLALQVKAASLLGVVEVEQFLEPFHHLLQVCLTSLGRFHVEDSACLVQRQTRRREARLSARGALALLRCRRCLLVGLGESPSEDSGTGKDNLSNNAMGLFRERRISAQVPFFSLGPLGL